MASAGAGRADRQGAMNKEKVAQQFVKFYYTVLNDKPDYLHQFYGANSTVVVSEAQDSGAPIKVDASSEEEIGKLLCTLFADVTVAVDTSFPQESIDGSVLLLVSGRMTRKGVDEERFFTQAFLLARQPSGFYIRTDTLQVHNRGSCCRSASDATQASSGSSGAAHPTRGPSAPEPQPESKPLLNNHSGSVVRSRDVSGLGLGPVANTGGLASDAVDDGSAPGAVHSLARPHVLDSLSLDADQGRREMQGVGEIAPTMVAAVSSAAAPGGIPTSGGVAAENGVKDLEVEPPSQIVAPIEKPIDVVAEAPPLDAPAPPAVHASTAAPVPQAVAAVAPPQPVVALTGTETATDAPIAGEYVQAPASTQKMSYAQILKSRAAAAASQAQPVSQAAPKPASDPVSVSQSASELQTQGWNARPRDKRRTRMPSQGDGSHGF